MEGRNQQGRKVEGGNQQGRKVEGKSRDHIGCAEGWMREQNVLFACFLFATQVECRYRAALPVFITIIVLKNVINVLYAEYLFLQMT